MNKLFYEKAARKMKLTPGQVSEQNGSSLPFRPILNLPRPVYLPGVNFDNIFHAFFHKHILHHSKKLMQWSSVNADNFITFYGNTFLEIRPMCVAWYKSYKLKTCCENFNTNVAETEQRF